MMKNESRFRCVCLLVVPFLLLLFASILPIRPTLVFPSIVKAKNSSLYLNVEILEQGRGQRWFDTNELSGEYEELPDLFPRRSSRFVYRLDEIFVALTSNTQRILDTIHEIQFWSQDPSIRCLITFDERDLRYHLDVHQWLKDRGVRCQILNSTAKRFEERYFHLLVQSWNLIESQSLAIRWLALSDDDTLWFMSNLLHLLREYNASELIYLGNISDRLESIQYHGDHFGYGGGGILLSRPLHARLVQSWNECRDKYSDLYGGDEMVGKCLVENLKINLTRNMHFHQFDHQGDLRGYLQSGINGVVALHHLFSSWEPFPVQHVRNESHLIALLRSAYDEHRIDLFKRYRKYNWLKNQTYLFTLGYSFSIIDQIVTPEEFQQVERTWCCTRMTARQFRPLLFHQIQWFFLNSTRIDGLRSTFRTYPPRWLPLPSLMQIRSE